MTLHHCLATLSYRLSKVVRDAPDSFANFPEGGPQTAGKIVAHIGDLMDWALSLVDGTEKWNDSAPLPWPQETARAFAAIDKLDHRLTNSGSGAASPERLFQGPIADALTHTGQLAMMRRLAGIPIKDTNYYEADIATSTVTRIEPK